MEGEPDSLSMENLSLENGEEKMKSANVNNERFQEAMPDDKCHNLQTKPSASVCSEDNCEKFNSKNSISTESSENDQFISETQTVTCEEPSKIRAITISNKKPVLKGSQSKPGVILLGRGNSFSLGRSEVILLHNRPVRRSKGSTALQGLGDNPLDSIQEQSNTPPSPPPISGGVSSKRNPHINGCKKMEDKDLLEEVESVGDTSVDIMDADAFAKSLHQLWSKAEEIMTANEGRVLKVLEEFGIGEQAGGGGGDDGGEGTQEEEQVWQIVQENYRGQR